MDVNIDVQIQRSMTPDSYTMATKVGQSIAAAFLKLGSHSQEITLSSSAPNWDEKQFYHSLRVVFLPGRVCRKRSWEVMRSLSFHDALYLVVPEEVI